MYFPLRFHTILGVKVDFMANIVIRLDKKVITDKMGAFSVIIKKFVETVFRSWILDYCASGEAMMSFSLYMRIIHC